MSLMMGKKSQAVPNAPVEAKNDGGSTTSAPVRRVNILLPAETKAELDALGRQTNRSSTELLRMAFDFLVELRRIQKEGHEIVETDAAGKPLVRLAFPKV